jgi:uncharacterized cupin superfamily protein
MVREAQLARRDEGGLEPMDDGWFVLNTREARWEVSDVFGRGCGFEGRARFPEVGFNVLVLEPGQPNCMYHAEDAQEDFLILAGECLLLVEGEERQLRPWDFVHCPPWTEHVFVGAGKGPCVLLTVGTRRPGGVVYPVNELARRHGAGVEAETDSPKEAYARFPEVRDSAYRQGDLPDYSERR